MPPRQRPMGKAPTGAVSGPGQQHQLRGLGDANLQPRGVSLGSGKDGTDAGKLDAQFAEVTLETGKFEYEVPHHFGRVPAWATKWETTNGPSGTCGYSVNSIQKDKWTASTIRIEITNVTGTVHGARLKLLLGG